MQQESRKEQHGRDNRGRPYQDATPTWRYTTEVLHKRERNQQSNDEPAVVKADRDAGDPAKLDLCLHGDETSNSRISASHPSLF